MGATEPKYEFDNQRKLHIVSNFEYLVRQLNNHGVDTTNLNTQ